MSYIKSHSSLFLSSGFLLMLVACDENDTTSPKTDPMSANGSTDYAYQEQKDAETRDFEVFKEKETTKRSQIQADATKAAQDLTAEGQERGEEWRFKSNNKTQDEETKREGMRQSGQTKTEIFRGLGQLATTVGGEGIRSGGQTKRAKIQAEGDAADRQARLQESWLRYGNEKRAQDLFTSRQYLNQELQTAQQHIGLVNQYNDAKKFITQQTAALPQLHANAAAAKDRADPAKNPEFSKLNITEQTALANSAANAQAAAEKAEQDIARATAMKERAEAEPLIADALKNNGMVTIADGTKISLDDYASKYAKGVITDTKRSLQANAEQLDAAQSSGLGRPASRLYAGKAGAGGNGGSPSNNPNPKIGGAKAGSTGGSINPDLSDIVQKAKADVKAQNEKLNQAIDVASNEDLQTISENELAEKLKSAGALTDDQAHELAKILKSDGESVEDAKIKAQEYGQQKMDKIDKEVASANASGVSAEEIPSISSRLSSIVGSSSAPIANSKFASPAAAMGGVGYDHPIGPTLAAKEIPNISVSNNFFNAKEEIPAFDEAVDESSGQYLCDTGAPCSTGAKAHLDSIASGIYEIAQLKKDLENTPSPNIQKVKEIEAKIGEKQDSVSKMLRAANGSQDVGGRYSRSLQAMSNALSDAVQKDSDDFFSIYGSQPKVEAVYAPYKTKEYVGSMLSTQPTACSRYGGGCGTQVAYNAASQPAIAQAGGDANVPSLFDNPLGIKQ